MSSTSGGCFPAGLATADAWLPTMGSTPPGSVCRGGLLLIASPIMLSSTASEAKYPSAPADVMFRITAALTPVVRAVSVTLRITR